MAVCAKSVILGCEDSLDGTHKSSALTGEVAVGLSLESGLEKVAASDTYAEGDGALISLACGILEDGV